MTDVTLRAMATLLDHRAIFESARLEGVLHPDAPGLDPRESRRARDLTWMAMEKILLHQPLTQEELKVAREALDWYRELPQARRLPVDTAEAMLEAWNLPSDAVGSREIDSVAFAILERWIDEDAVKEDPETGREGSQAYAASDDPRLRHSGDVPLSAAEACEKARMGLSRLTEKLAEGHVGDALVALGEVEAEIEKVRDALGPAKR